MLSAALSLSPSSPHSVPLPLISLCTVIHSLLSLRVMPFLLATVKGPVTPTSTQLTWLFHSLQALLCLLGGRFPASGPLEQFTPITHESLDFAASCMISPFLLHNRSMVLSQGESPFPPEGGHIGHCLGTSLVAALREGDGHLVCTRPEMLL